MTRSTRQRRLWPMVLLGALVLAGAAWAGPRVLLWAQLPCRPLDRWFGDTGCTAAIPIAKLDAGIGPSLALLPDGDTALVVGSQHLVETWGPALVSVSLSQGREITRRPLDIAGNAPSWFMIAAPKGDLIVATGLDMMQRRLKLFRVADAAEIGTIPAAWWGARFSPDGRMLVTGFGDDRQGWQIPEGKPWTGSLPWIRPVHASSQSVLTSTGDAAVLFKAGRLSVEQGGIGRELVDYSNQPVRGFNPQTMAVSPDDTMVAMIWSDYVDQAKSQIDVRRLSDGADIGSLTIPGRVINQIAWTPDSRSIAVVRQDEDGPEIDVFALP